MMECMNTSITFLGALIGVGTLLLPISAIAQYDYYDPYSNSNIDYFPMNPVDTSPSSSGSTGSTGDTTGGTSGSTVSPDSTYTTTTTCANTPLANPSGTRSVEIRDKEGKVFYLSPPKEELAGYRSYPATSVKIFKVIYGTGGVEVGVEEVGLITVSGTCYPKYGYVKDPYSGTEKTVTTTASATLTANATTDTTVPENATAVRLDPATGKVYNAASGALMSDARYDAAARKIYYRDTTSTYGTVFTETSGYVNLDTRGIAPMPPPSPTASYQYNETDLDFVRAASEGTEAADLDRDKTSDRATPSTNDGNNENWDFGGSDRVAPSAGAEEKGNVEYSWKVEKGESIEIDGELVRGWDPATKEEFLRARQEFAEVRSGQDLERFAAGVLLDDDALTEVVLGDETLEVISEEKGKLFWFIPVTYMSRVVVRFTPSDSTADSAAVSVRFPWWSVFVKKAYSADALEGEVRGSLSAVSWEKVDNSEAPVPSERVADTTGTFDPTKWETLARTLGLVSNIMKTKHDTVKNSVSNVR